VIIHLPMTGEADSEAMGSGTDILDRPIGTHIRRPLIGWLRLVQHWVMSTLAGAPDMTVQVLL
jgi:hypothetical protein